MHAYLINLMHEPARIYMAQAIEKVANEQEQGRQGRAISDSSHSAQHHQHNVRGISASEEHRYCYGFIGRGVSRPLLVSFFRFAHFLLNCKMKTDRFPEQSKRLERNGADCMYCCRPWFAQTVNDP